MNHHGSDAWFERVAQGAFQEILTYGFTESGSGCISSGSSTLRS